VETILILDFGSQYTQLIARRVREMQVYCEIHPYTLSMEEIRALAPRGVILSGGHQSVYDDGAPDVDPALLTMGVPVLGICYGMQLMARRLGGEVAAAARREYGHARLWRSEAMTGPMDPALDVFSAFLETAELSVWMSHGDHVERLPDGFRVAACSDNAPIAAMEDPGRRMYGVQFHPEVSHTTHGERLLRAFVRGVCACQGSWTSSHFISESITRLTAQVGAERVLLGLSGGVDSAVAAALLHRAIGDRLVCVFVDNGLLRLHEGDEVMETFARHMGVQVIRVDASERFLGRLAGVTDPEQKRKIIGHTFIEVFEEESRKISDVHWLAQGTIYPDVIESAGAKTKTAANIKSHHNVGGLPERMNLKLLEPLRELFKDEVRKVGLELGLPRTMVFRHPFPGPGLGVRILGEVKAEYADLLRKADAIYIEELRAAGLYESIAQAFVVFLPVKSVGVMGDGRSYQYVVALRAVETTDYMTASWFPLPHDLLARTSNRIINEVPGINRVTYDITSKPPGTIEWE
jgi:GMP synthase (glutamine-hydrolysing)